MTRVFLLIILTIFAISCSKYKVEGSSSLNHLDGKMVYMCNFTEDLVPLDSAEIIHGAFKMSGEIDSTMMVILFMDRKPLGTMVLESGTISVDLLNADFRISGTELNDRLYSFTRKKRDYENKLNKIDSKIAQKVMAGEDYDIVKEEYSKETDALLEKYDMLIDSFITSNYDNVLSESVFLLMCYSTPAEALPESFYSIYEKAPESFKSNDIIEKYISILYPDKVMN